jgi:hypothetical protein
MTPIPAIPPIPPIPPIFSFSWSSTTLAQFFTGCALSASS